MLATLRDIWAIGCTIPRTLLGSELSEYPTTLGKPLVVLLHGIHGNVHTLDALFEAFRSYGVSVCAPRMPSTQLPADMCAEMVVCGIANYLQSHPTVSSVALVGLSNGGRVACFVELLLRQTHPHIAVIVISIAAPIWGTTTVDRYRIGVWLLGLSDVVQDHLTFKSPHSMALVDRLSDDVPGHVGRRHYVFIATRHDQLVQPYWAALPVIHKSEHHILLENWGHLSILSYMHDSIIQHVMQFIT